MFSQLFGGHNYCSDLNDAKVKKETAARCSSDKPWLPRGLRDNAKRLCTRWALLTGASALRTASYGWNELLENTTVAALPQLVMTRGRLERMGPSTFSDDGHGTSPLAHLSLIDASSTIARVKDLMQQIPPNTVWLAHAEHAILLANGVVYFGSPDLCSSGSKHSSGAVAIRSPPQVTVLDLSGGCCRPQRTLSAKEALKAGVMSGRSPPAGSIKEFADLAVDSAEHEWLYMCTQSHGSTYFHGLAEAAPRLLFGVQLFKSNPQIRVVVKAKTVITILELLGFPGRSLEFQGKVMFAKKVTIPPYGGVATQSKGRQVWRTILQAMRLEVARNGGYNTTSPYTLLVVRRSASVRKNGRAMLNHDNVMAALRQILSPSKDSKSHMPLLEWPPAATLQQAAASWGDARLVIAPHGAGGTNVMFMSPGSTYVEILAKQQKGRVYGSLARLMGVNYVACTYDREDPRFQYQLYDRMTNDNFVVDVRWLLGCIRDGLNPTRGTARSPFTEKMWETLDHLVVVEGNGTARGSKTAKFLGKGRAMKSIGRPRSKGRGKTRLATLRSVSRGKGKVPALRRAPASDAHG